MNTYVFADLEVEDLPTIMAKGREMHKEGAFGSTGFSEKKVLQMLVACISQDDFYCEVAKCEGHLVGFFIAAISSNWYSEERSAKELAFYVEPAHRGRKLASALIQGFVTWGKSRKALSANAGSSSGINNEGVRRLCESEGFVLNGYNLEKRI